MIPPAGPGACALLHPNLSFITFPSVPATSSPPLPPSLLSLSLSAFTYPPAAAVGALSLPSSHLVLGKLGYANNVQGPKNISTSSRPLW